MRLLFTWSRINRNPSEHRQDAVASSLDPTEGDDAIYFTAETAIRRLLNRIHNSLYALDSDLAMTAAVGATTFNNTICNKILALSSELDRQLDEWHRSIPVKLRPPNLCYPKRAKYTGRFIPILSSLESGLDRLVHVQSLLYPRFCLDSDLWWTPSHISGKSLLGLAVNTCQGHDAP